MARKLIELRNICLNYDGQKVLENLNLNINEQEFVTLLGASGCGKTTTLRILGGFLKPDSGDVLIDGKSIINMPSYNRPVNTVFQKYALFPKLNVSENIAFGLENSSHSKVYHLGLVDLLEEYKFDEDYIADAEKYMEQFNTPRQAKKGALEFLHGQSKTNITLDKLKCTHKTNKKYKEYFSEVCSDNQVVTKLNPEKYSFFKLLKELKKEQLPTDKYLQMEERILNHKFKKEVIAKEVTKTIKLVNLVGFEKRDISELSGGQQQRVAIARAVINKPQILLLDEPLSALDLKLRQQMRYELKDIQQTLGITFIFVTHDQEEAMTMSDTIVVMNGGKIEQIGTPQGIYNAPKNRFVAEFIGQSNILPGTYLGKSHVSFLNHDFECDTCDFKDGDIIFCIVEKNDFDIVSLDNATIVGTIQKVTRKNQAYILEVDVNKQIINVQTINHYKVGDKVGLVVDAANIHCESLDEKKEYLLANYEGDNIIVGKYLKRNQVSFLGATFECYVETFSVGEKVQVLVRPEDFDLVIDNPEQGDLVGTVLTSIFTGVHFEMKVKVGDTVLLVHDYNNVNVGDKLGLKIDSYEIHLMRDESK
jgi:spermidine/putrescine transport system ATP-binding protein